MKIISSVPTNIITGFLGVGKTTAILHLLQSKPENERWAVLVNEFGEVGVDGALIEGQTDQQSVFIREVPGGCMCCTSGLPMQIALNMLLARAKPDRLLVEPTGLGHPEELLESFQGPSYQSVLDVKATLTLVDARNLTNERYTSHDIFQQQLGVADVVVANKTDLYAEKDKDNLLSSPLCEGKRIELVSQGEIQQEWLELPCEYQAKPASTVSIMGSSIFTRTPQTSNWELEPIPESGYLKFENQGEGFVSIGWRFAENISFDKKALTDLLMSLPAERVKAVFCSDTGCYSLNCTAESLAENSIADCAESRIEIICDQVDSNWEQSILSVSTQQ